MSKNHIFHIGDKVIVEDEIHTFWDFDHYPDPKKLHVGPFVGEIVGINDIWVLDEFITTSYNIRSFHADIRHNELKTRLIENVRTDRVKPYSK